MKPSMFELVMNVSLKINFFFKHKSFHITIQYIVCVRFIMVPRFKSLKKTTYNLKINYSFSKTGYKSIFF